MQVGSFVVQKYVFVNCMFTYFLKKQKIAEPLVQEGVRRKRNNIYMNNVVLCFFQEKVRFYRKQKC